MYIALFQVLPGDTHGGGGGVAVVLGGAGHAHLNMIDNSRHAPHLLHTATHPNPSTHNKVPAY